MYLKSLELQGFKSFANRTKLEFKKGITTIIGPNGSGKSNIVDAIKWVLGEQSIKELRGSKSDDVIFNGTQNRKSLGFADVTMVLDNEDQTLPIEYNEVTITRRLYRTGETGYYINKVPCRLKDITELFMDTGIGKDGYSIIGQGKIDAILSNKSEDRRKIFDEAAGIVKYRTRRDETEKKLEQTKINLVRINDIIAEIETTIEPLKIQSDKAKKYLELKEELKKIEIGLYLLKIDSFNAKLEEVKKDKELLNSQNDDENKKLEDLQSLKEKIKNELNNINEKIEDIQNLSFESKNKIEKINSNISLSNERIDNNKKNKNKLEIEIEEANKNLANLNEEIEIRKNKKETLLKNKEKFDKELKEKEEELEKVTSTLSKKELEIEEKKKANDDLIEKRFEMQNQITMNETNVENFNERIKQIAKDITKLELELDEKRNKKNEIVNEKNKIEKIAKDDLEQLNEILNKKEKIEEKNKEYENEINNVTDEKRMKTTKYNFLVETEKEKEGYTHSVKEILNECEKNVEMAKGVCGILANLISTQKEYETAIEMSLGSNIQNIVTENENDAKKLINFLRNNKLGRASFLPISSMKGKKIEEIYIENGKKVQTSKLNGENGVIGLASDLIKTDKKYDGIVNSLLGRTIITDNIENAIRLAKSNNHSFKIVTLEGDIINPSGTMTGGSIQKKSFNILGRKEEIKALEKEIKEIDSKIEDLVSKKDEFNNENKEILLKIDDLNEKSKNSQIDLASIKEKLNATENEINTIIQNKDKFEKQKQELNESILNANNEKQKLENEIKEINSNLEEIQIQIDNFKSSNKEEQTNIDNLNEEITNLKISVSSFDESNFSMKEMIDRISNDIENEEKKIENDKDEINKMDAQNEELVETIKELELNIEKIKNDVESGETKEKELREKREEKNNNLNSLENDITKQFETIQTIKEGIVKVESKETSISQNLTDTINDLWNDYEITPNNAREKYETKENLNETQKNVNELHEKIRNLGDVNVSAIEEYKNTMNRYTTMSDQRYDLENTIAKLRNVIEELTEEMKKQFKEKFKLIQKNFNQVFVELFGGGKAELILEDENNVLESGIDIKAEPTGKKLQNMMLLSGGEKALTAIALLFAILQINPSPFCILDEIEAALDDVNVYRYAQFLKKLSKNTQFIVITHRKGTMEIADTVYGVTMEENGVSKLLSLDLKNE